MGYFFNKPTPLNPTYTLKDIKMSSRNIQSSFLTLQFSIQFSVYGKLLEINFSYLNEKLQLKSFITIIKSRIYANVKG